MSETSQATILIRNARTSRNVSTLQFEAPAGRLSANVKDHEAVVWLTAVPDKDLSIKSVEQFRELARLRGARPFPSLIDTGCTLTCVLHKWHWENFAGIPECDQIVVSRKAVYLYGLPCTRVRVALMMHLGAPGEEGFKEGFLLNTTGGVIKSSIQIDRLTRLQEEAEPSKRKRFGKRSPGKTEVSGKDDTGRWLRRELTRDDSIPPGTYPRLPIIGNRLLRLNRFEFRTTPHADTFSIIRH